MPTDSEKISGWEVIVLCLTTNIHEDNVGRLF